jgi:hypothetical protein
LDVNLAPAREVLGHAAGSAAWLEGWGMPVEKAVEEVMTVEGSVS